LRELAVAAIVLMALPPSVQAQPYPHKPIRLLVGFTPGGAADTSARTISRKMGEAMRTTFVVENRAGAGGNIAAEIVSNGNPDGYTLFWGSVGPLSVSAALGVKLPYDVFTGFAPVGLAVTSCNVLATRAAAKFENLADVIAQTRARPGKVNYASQGMGSTGHLAGELLRSMTSIDVVHVPYKGGAEVVTALLGGEVELAFVSVTALRGAGAGRMKPLAVTCGKRDPGVPAVPTFAESGVPGYDVSFWYGLLAPPRTPAPVIERLNQELRTALADPGIAQPLQAQGLIAAVSSPREFSSLMHADYEKWKRTFAGRTEKP
jgi:tripartite-type tricarboxylate transporter receptor subunit TctC